MKILMVLTSNDRLGNTGEKTGFWLEEFTAPFYVFKDAGVKITLASPRGGQPPIDPRSDAPDAQTESTKRFRADKDAQAALSNTLSLREVAPRDYDAVFYPGGHGPLWDLVDNQDSISLIEAMYASGRPVAAVCHAPAVLRNAKSENGLPLVSGKSITGFSNSEEATVELTEVVPFLLEDELKSKGAGYSKKEDFQPYHISDGNLITGQNPASSEAVAKALLRSLER